jgi:glutamine amidotransferase
MFEIAKEVLEMIGIIDYGMGNLMSVQKAFAYLGIDALVTDKPEIVAGCDKIVLPGVGAFGDAMASLRETGLCDAILESANAGKPLLGICLGMQLLFDKSYEGGEYAGLALLPGEITRLDAKNAAQQIFGRGALKIPHMGWNSLDIKISAPLFTGINNTYVYFDHAYCLADDSTKVSGDIIAATCEYGITFTAAARRDNIFALQFHPEKSGATGLAMLRGFAKL